MTVLHESNEMPEFAMFLMGGRAICVGGELCMRGVASKGSDHWTTKPLAKA